MASVLLALNRGLTLYNPQAAEWLFDGELKMAAWLMLPTTALLYYFVFMPPLLYSSISASWLWHPHSGYYPLDPYVIAPSKQIYL
jgi:Serpentine type 7TM GPCR chemoreceptor Srt